MIMPKTIKRWMEQDELFGAIDGRGRFSRRRALKVKRELRRLAYY